MSKTKLKLAVNWAAACGGCDVALLDLEQQLLDVAALVDFVYWPVATDFKRDDLAALPDGSVDVGLFNGAVRTAEQRQDAQLMRRKCRVLIAFGSCACFGGIPALANTSDKEALLSTVYDGGDAGVASNDNPDEVRPHIEHAVEPAGTTWTLPELDETVAALHQVTEVDLFAPGCPPPQKQIEALVEVLAALAAGEEPTLPEHRFFAAERGLCQECPRGATRGSAGPPAEFVGHHLVQAREDLCLMDQGIVCMGIATRGGCGASCISANMPCRGCFGPLPGQLDPAAEIASAIAVLPGPRGNWEMPVHKIVSPARSVTDPLGTFYRFTYAVSMGRHKLRDGEKR